MKNDHFYDGAWSSVNKISKTFRKLCKKFPIASKSTQMCQTQWKKLRQNSHKEKKSQKSKNWIAACDPCETKVQKSFTSSQSVKDILQKWKNIPLATHIICDDHAVWYIRKQKLTKFEKVWKKLKIEIKS